MPFRTYRHSSFKVLYFKLVLSLELMKSNLQTEVREYILPGNRTEDHEFQKEFKELITTMEESHLELEDLRCLLKIVDGFHRVNQKR